MLTSLRSVFITTSLFLRNPPDLAIAILQREISINETRPLDSRFHFNNPAAAIQMQNPVQPSNVYQHSISAKLLPSHRVPPTGNRNHLPILACAADDLLYLCRRLRLENSEDASGIELGMNIIDEDLVRSGD